MKLITEANCALCLNCLFPFTNSLVRCIALISVFHRLTSLHFAAIYSTLIYTYVMSRKATAKVLIEEAKQNLQSWTKCPASVLLNLIHRMRQTMVAPSLPLSKHNGCSKRKVTNVIVSTMLGFGGAEGRAVSRRRYRKRGKICLKRVSIIVLTLHHYLCFSVTAS